MEQIPNYNLLQAIDPTKVKVPISERFAKLTLSSNKKQQQKCDVEPDQQKENKIQKEKRDSVARNISKQFENEVQGVVQNPLLRSESSKEIEMNISLEDLTMDRLEVSDGGAENCTEQEKSKFELLSQKMASLMVETKPISLSSSSTPDLSVTDYLSSESQPPSIGEADQIHIIHNIPINVKEAAKQETIPLNFTSFSNDNLEKSYQMTTDDETEEVEEEEGDDYEEEADAITISDTSGSHHETEQNIMATSGLPSISTNSGSLSLPSLVADKAERVAAFLRDVSVEHHAMSELGQLIVHDTIDRILDNEEMEKMQEIVMKAKQIAEADTELMTTDGDVEVTPTSRLERAKRLKAVKEQYQNDNDKTFDNTVGTKLHKNCNDEETPNIIFKDKKVINHGSSKTPEVSAAGVYRLANDETQCNTDFILNEKTCKDNQPSEHPPRRTSLETRDFLETPLKDNVTLSPKNQNKEKLFPRRFANEDTVANSGTLNHNFTKNCKTPDRNYSVNLTSTSPVDEPLINSSYEECNHTAPEVCITISETGDEDSDDKKLSNSFHIQESSDSEYEQHKQKVQLSKASINISAKINIKIHIPQSTSSSEDEQNDDLHTPDNVEIENTQSQQLTDRISTKTSEDEHYLNGDHNNEANEFSKNDSHIQDRSADKATKAVKKDKSHDRNHSYKSNNQRVQTATPQRACKQLQTKKLNEKSSYTTNKALDSSPEMVEDEKFLSEAEKLLNQLYGKSWQTPDVIRTLKRTNQSEDKRTNSSSVKNKAGSKNIKEEKSDIKAFVEETVLHDFSLFRQNIVTTNLDSTRLATPDPAMQQRIETNTELRNRRKPLKQKTDSRAQPQTERKPKTASIAKTTINKRPAYNERWRQLIDNDSNSEGDNASDDVDADDSWSKNSSALEVDDSDLDSDFEISSKSKSRKNKKKSNTTKLQTRSEKSTYLTKVLNKSKHGEIVYLDLSKDEVEVQEEVPTSPPANHDLSFASRLQDILKTCRHQDKAKLPCSNKKSKRKLFTPKFGDDDFERCEPEDDLTKPKDDDKENVNGDDILQDSGNCPFDSLGRPKVFDLVNKPSEGTPIFQLTPSSKKKNTQADPVTPSSTSTNKAKSNDEAKFKTPSTAKTKTQPIKVLKASLQTPNYKYSFLKSLDVTVSKTLCHPDALYYRDNYRTKKEELSKILYDMYNEKLFGSKLEVPLLWNKKLLNTAGRCLNKKKLGIRSSVVELSEKVLTSADRLRCTLIHELCHAATWIFSGEGGHGSTWKEWARKANAVFPEIPKIGVCHQYDIEYKYTYQCTLCAAKSYTHSKSKKVENIRCSYCHGAIEVFLNKKDKDGNVIPTPVKEATGFAKFVKENYKKFKRDDLKHADIMKLLSNEFASLKVTSN